MEEVYAVLYRIIAYDDEYYEYEPCYVIKGKLQDGFFIDDMGRDRRQIFDPISVSNGWGIGEIYTITALKEKYPQAKSLEEAKDLLLDDEENCFISGVYDPDNKCMYIDKSDEEIDEELEREAEAPFGYDDSVEEDDNEQEDTIEILKNTLKQIKKKMETEGKDGSQAMIQFNMPIELLENILERNPASKSGIKTEVMEADLYKLINQGIDQLENLVGLEDVKKSIKGIIATLYFKNRTKDYLKFENDSKHMVFTGPPGTGKTTVAEIIAPIFYEIGYLRSPQVKFVSAQDIIGEYVGQTAPKTEAVIKSAKGGIIVLDEAYILAGEAQEYGNEAITVILKEMEKNDTMFIFAGYKKEMEKFMNMNSGIKSRIGKYINFKDYSAEELYKIFDQTIKDISKDSVYKLGLTKEAKEKVKKILEKATKIENFGNGRFVKNLCNAIIMQHAMNTYNSDDIQELYTVDVDDVKEEDFDNLIFNADAKKVTIGFSAEEPGYAKKKTIS